MTLRHRQWSAQGHWALQRVTQTCYWSVTPINSPHGLGFKPVTRARTGCTSDRSADSCQGRRIGPQFSMQLSWEVWRVRRCDSRWATWASSSRDEAIAPRPRQWRFFQGALHRTLGSSFARYGLCTGRGWNPPPGFRQAWWDCSCLLAPGRCNICTAQAPGSWNAVGCWGAGWSRPGSLRSEAGQFYDGRWRSLSDWLWKRVPGGGNPTHDLPTVLPTRLRGHTGLGHFQPGTDSAWNLWGDVPRDGGAS